jgi:site-specific DNA recombinase
MGQTERVALYARVSTEMQAEEGFSIEAQLNEMRAYAAQRGWKVVAEFVDAGISGSTMDRPGLRALLEAAQAHQFDVVLVHELSRLSRSVFDTFEIFEQLGRAQVGFASVREPQFNLLDPHGRFFLTMIASINQYYLDMLRLHTQKSKRERARQGLYNASVAPYGYRHVGDARTPPEVVEEEAKVVRRVFEMYATGRYTCRQIAEVLNGEGYRTRSGRRFSKDSITEMLRNPFYIGKVTYREGRRGEVEVYDGLHEPIVSEGLWEAAARVRNQQTVRRVLRGEKRPYLLGGIARCHTCGRRLRAQGAQAGDYYRDTTVLTGYDDCPYGQSGVRAEVVHEQVGRILRGLRLPEEWREEMAALVGEDEEAGTLRSRRERLIAERRRLKRAYLAGDFDEDEDIYREHLERIREELARLPTEDDLKRIGEAARVLETVGEVWDEAEEADRRDLVQLILREVEVDVGQGRLVALKPHAPFIPLFRTMAGVEEREFGVFVPVWPVEEGGVVGHRLEAVREVGEEAVALPFVVKWPWEMEAEARVSPTVSALLKERRSGGKEGGRVVVVPRVGVPEVRVDGRKWPEVAGGGDGAGGGVGAEGGDGGGAGDAAGVAGEDGSGGDSAEGVGGAGGMGVLVAGGHIAGVHGGALGVSGVSWGMEAGGEGVLEWAGGVSAVTGGGVCGGDGGVDVLGGGECGGGAGGGEAAAGGVGTVECGGDTGRGGAAGADEGGAGGRGNAVLGGDVDGGGGAEGGPGGAEVSFAAVGA